MYAINHAATALLLKRRFPRAPLVPLLISVQLMELLWIALHFLRLEHIELVNGLVELGVLPFSHSVASGLGLALLVGSVTAFALRRPELGLALGLGVASHLALDLVMHKPDIALTPLVGSPRLGLGVYGSPELTLAVELGYGLLCWRVYRGGPGLLATIVALNLLDLPFIFPHPLPATVTVAQADLATTSVIALQTLLSWGLVWRFARGAPARPDAEPALRSATAAR